MQNRYCYIKLIATVLMLCLGVSAVRAQYHDLPVDDQLLLSGCTLTPGSSEGAVIAVRLKGVSDTAIYTAYDMDIHIPSGFTVTDVTRRNAKGAEYNAAMYPSATSHLFDWNMLPDGRVRVACMSFDNKNLLSTQGDFFYVWLKGLPPYERPRLEPITVDSVLLVKALDAQGYIPQTDTAYVTVSTEVYVPITVSGTYHWSTCILPFDAAVPDGVIAYATGEADIAEQHVYLEPQSSLSAFTPYILYSESGFSGTLQGTANADDYPAEPQQSGYLVGVLQDTRIYEGYVLQALGGKVQFYRVDPTAVVPAGKAYLLLPAEMPSLTIIRRDGVTNLDTRVIEQLEDSAPCYDMMGRKVNFPKSRVYINNGKIIYLQ